MLLRLTPVAAGWLLATVLVLAMPIPECRADFTDEEYAAYAARLANTPHDFTRPQQEDSSVPPVPVPDGPQPMCVICHTPDALPGPMVRPLWAPLTAGAEFSVFGDRGTGGRGPVFRESTFACLTCHDGFGSGGLLMDILSDHPVGVNYPVDRYSVEFRAISGRTETLAFFDMNANGRPDSDEIRLYRYGDRYTVECASCHDPHGDERGQREVTRDVALETRGGTRRRNPFLRVSQTIVSEVCITCHIK